MQRGLGEPPLHGVITLAVPRARLYRDLDILNLNPALLGRISSLPEAQKAELLTLLDELEKAKEVEAAQTEFMPFVKSQWPAFIEGEHHKVMAEAFERVATGQCKRMIINLGPRHTKSEFSSFLFPAWFLGNYPNKKVIQCSHTAELAVGFGRKVRNLVGSEEYRKIFPDVNLQADSKAAGRWSTNKGGEYFAIGIGGAVTGKGADLLIIDDPHSEQEAALGDPSVYNRTYEWYTSGPRQRLQPGGAIIIVMCMVGDTPVLMADGTEKPLKDIKPGDLIATYDGGKITTSTVVNHQSNGVDAIFTVQTQSGRILRANERHPFLVEVAGERKWIQLKDLKVGMELVSTQVATLQSDMGSLQTSCVTPLSTYSVTTDAIVRISPDGYEEVFDVQIDKTENFIANGVVSHNTRWHQKDLTGRVLKSSIERGGVDEWEVIELPAILPSGKPLWPEFWSLKELESIKAELPVAKWSAQYQQNPTSEEGAIVKRDWWRVWEKEDPPPCEFIIQSWDTAFTKKQTSDFSACTTWGVFKYPNPETGVTQNNIILLDAVKERMEFPELKRKAYEMYHMYSPDAFIVEAKAAGAPLIYELRAMGIPVSEFTPSRGNDKVARVNAVSDLFSSGVVWAPQTRWAEEVVEEFASFPNAEHDDLVDSSTQALLRFRQGGFVSIESDEPYEKVRRVRKAPY